MIIWLEAIQILLLPLLDGDEDLKAFLFSLGCYSGEKITVVDKHKNLVVSIKDARYNIDPDLAEVIEI